MGKLKPRARTLGWLVGTRHRPPHTTCSNPTMCPTPLAWDFLVAARAQADFWTGTQAGRGSNPRKWGQEARAYSFVHGKSLGTCAARRRQYQQRQLYSQSPSCPQKARNGTGNPKPVRDKIRGSRSCRGHHGYSLMSPGLPASPEPDAVTPGLAASAHTEILVSPPSAK